MLCPLLMADGRVGPPIATADALTGRRTILHYLLKPVVRAFSGAMTQR